MPRTDVLSIPAGRTFALVEKYKIHACPDTSAYNYRLARYMAFRKSGGEMDALYPFEQVLTVDPYDAATIESLDEGVGERIIAYIEERHRTAGFRHLGKRYRFYNLLEESKVDLPHHPQMVPNGQNHCYFTLEELLSGRKVVQVSSKTAHVDGRSTLQAPAETERFNISHWIFSVTAHKGHDYSLSAEEIFRQRMEDGFWGLNERNVNFKNLKEGDEVIFYVGSPKSVFAGRVTLASAGIHLSDETQEKLSHGISFYRSDAGVWLRDIEIWEPAQPVESLIPVLSFIKNKDSWYAYFQGGIVKIQESNFQVIINSLEEPSTVGTNWSENELRETVESYFRILSEELQGAVYSKTTFRNELLSKIRRTKGAIEYKYRNISAALIAKGLPYIDGYKPASNYQRALDETIDSYIESHPGFLQLVALNIERAANDVPPTDFTNVLEDPPEPTEKEKNGAERKRSYQARKYDFTQRESERLGKMGEEFVVSYEQQRLTNAGRPDLAEKVERISETRGDGAGYDVLSFEEDGTERYIEVKTTNSGKNYPFYISANELDFSGDFSDSYYLYRIFNFKKSPKLFILKGSLKERYEVTPTVYRLSF